MFTPCPASPTALISPSLARVANWAPGHSPAGPGRGEGEGGQRGGRRGMGAEEWGFCADVRALVGAFAAGGAEGGSPGPALGLRRFLAGWEGGGGGLLHAARPPRLEPEAHTRLLFAAALRELQAAVEGPAPPPLPLPAGGERLETGGTGRGRRRQRRPPAAPDGPSAAEARARARRWGGWYAVATLWASQPALHGAGGRPVPVYVPLPALQALDEVLEEAEGLGEPEPAELLLGLLRRDAIVVGACPGADFRTDESVAKSGAQHEAAKEALPPAKRRVAAPALAHAVREELWDALEGPLAGAGGGLGAQAAAYARLLGELRPGAGTGVEECARQAERLSGLYSAALEEILGPREGAEPAGGRPAARKGAPQRDAGAGGSGRPLPAAMAVQLDAEDLALLEAVPQKHRPKVRRVLEITKRRRLAEEAQAAPGPVDRRAADSAAARSLVLRRPAGAPERPSESEGESESGEDYDAEDLEQALLEELEGPPQKKKPGRDR